MPKMKYRVSDLIGLEWGLDIEVFKSSPGELNMWIKLRTTDLGAQKPLWALETYTWFVEKTYNKWAN